MVWRRTRGRSVVAIIAAASIALVACGGDVATDPAAEDEPDPVDGADDADDEGADEGAENDEHVVLTFWNWVPEMDSVVELFNEEHPDIHVDLEHAGQGEEHYQRLRTALEAGTGAPDIAQIEYQHLPSYTITDSLVDLSEYGAADHADGFVDWVWDQVTGDDGAVWAMPMDTGPMGMLYRADVFDEFGVDVPETWEEFAEAARALNTADPDVHITNLAPDQTGQINGFFWQAGHRPFSVDGEEVAIDFDSGPARMVLEYWQELLDDDLVTTDPAYTDEWYRGFTEARHVTWLTGAWGPTFLQGAIPDTEGSWRAAPLPRWADGDDVTANFGGSTHAVVNQTDHPAEAATFATWLSTNEEALRIKTDVMHLFPAVLSVLEDPAFLDHEPDFYGGQQVNRTFVEESHHVEIGYDWSPFQLEVYDAMERLFSPQATAGGDLPGALEQVHDHLVDYAERQGFTIR